MIIFFYKESKKDTTIKSPVKRPIAFQNPIYQNRSVLKISIARMKALKKLIPSDMLKTLFNRRVIPTARVRKKTILQI